MKTVMDAVNEFEGEWPKTVNPQYLVTNGDALSTWGVDEDIRLLADAWSIICTKQEFNDLVSQLETNFGVCKLTYAKYKRAVTKSTKELEVMDIDWSKAPDDCAGALQHKDIDYKYTHGRFVRSCTSFDNYEYCISEEIYPCMDFFTLIPRPEAQPVFTQAMADNGELPQVGMEVKYLNLPETFVVMLPKDKDGDFIISPKGGKYWQRADMSAIKPIDTRTDKEKAFDEHFEKSGCDYKYQSILRNAFDAGVKWVGE